ncbi:tetratricopeptide repeat protein [Candidatus Obscuribacterales bacterium]|nr:tetratricopeptide repeat protein [Candidatus Obscuribacterales bacterium]
MIRKLSFVLLALSLPLMQQICFAADEKWVEESNAGASNYNARKYDEASRVFEAALKRMEADSATTETDLASCCLWLGYVYSARGMYAKAEPLYKRALAIYEKPSVPPPPFYRHIHKQLEYSELGAMPFPRAKA